jgi:septal ring factor EnvC (AmiA/AmiB activator)
MNSPDVVARERGFEGMSDVKPTIEAPVARAARLEVEVEDLRHELRLARAIGTRRARDNERLEQEISALRAERDAFRRQFDERNHLLATILNSRSFRIIQVIRRAFGRV